MKTLPFSVYNPHNEEDNNEPFTVIDPNNKDQVDAFTYCNVACLHRHTSEIIERESRTLLARVHEKLSYKEIAKALGINQTHMSNIAQGRYRITPEKFYRLAKLYSNLQKKKHAN